MARVNTTFGGWTLCSCGIIAQDHNTDNPNGPAYLADYPGLSGPCWGYDGQCVSPPGTERDRLIALIDDMLVEVD